jgi:hypothetical protein
MVRSAWLPLTSWLAVLPVAAFALWLSAAAAIAQDGTKTGTPDGAKPPPRRASVALEEAFRYVKKLPPGDTLALAAQGTPEGHWRFVNQSGEMFTVGTPDEMKRVATVLYPDAKDGAPLVLYMTEDTVLGKGVRFYALPARAKRYVVVGEKSYPLVPASGEPRYAQVRPKVVVEVRANPLLKEALERLDNPLDRAGVRLLALEPGGPKALPKTPEQAPGGDAGKTAGTERIDPASLADVLLGLSGQTLVVCARGDGDLIYVRPSNGPERSLHVGDLIAAAEGANVNVALVVLQFASTPPAPGSAPCPDAGRPAAELTLGDILNAAAAQSQQAPVAVALAGRLRVLDATMVGSDPEAGTAIRLDNARQRRLDRGLIGDTPLPVPALYAALLLLGWLGTPVARKWWGAMWKVGTPTRYAGPTGYLAASTVSFLAFALVFQPLTSVLTAPYNLVPQVWGAIMGPVRVWRRITRRGGSGKLEKK